MKTKKRTKVVPRVIEQEERDHSSDASEADSDQELIEAYEKGELQPGLNTILPYARKEVVNNIDALKQKLLEISNDYAWIERLDMVNEPVKLTPQLSENFGDIDLKMNRHGEVSGEEKVDKASHDFKREMLL